MLYIAEIVIFELFLRSRMSDYEMEHGADDEMEDSGDESIDDHDDGATGRVNGREVGIYKTVIQILLTINV